MLNTLKGLSECELKLYINSVILPSQAGMLVTLKLILVTGARADCWDLLGEPSNRASDCWEDESIHWATSRTLTDSGKPFLEYILLDRFLCGGKAPGFRSVKETIPHDDAYSLCSSDGIHIQSSW